jgi:uracil-DNA glycosylase
MDPVVGGPHVQDTLAMADPLAVLVLLGAVAAAASLSVTEGAGAPAVAAGTEEPPRADDVVKAWLDSLVMPSPLNR